MSLRRKHDFDWGQGSTRVLVGLGLLGDVARCCREVGNWARAAVVTDDHLVERYATPVVDALRASGYATELAVVPAGEASKSLDQASKLYDWLASFGLARDGLVVAVGGGMISDLAGFVAATWMRGVTTVLCPTTLEADIDAGIGGKTGVNHPAGKNLIGVFHHPRLVVIDTACLKTLSDRDLVAGMAESVKHAVITGEPFTSWHECNVAGILSRDGDLLAELIDRNIIIKANVVARDEREQTGQRATLNFGHTIGHAIEAVLEYELRHGECVSLGMVAACRLSQSLGLLSEDVCDRIVALLGSFGLPIQLHKPVDADAVWAYLRHDKKVRGDSPRWVLLKDLGQTVIESNVPEHAVRSAIASLQPS